MQIHVPAGLGPQPVPAGSYKARITKVELKRTQTGKDQINFEYTIQSNGPQGETTIGRKVFDGPVIQENTMWRINIPFQACTGEELPNGDYSLDEFFGIVSSDCQNKEVIIDVITEVQSEGKRKGELTNKVENVHNISGAPITGASSPVTHKKEPEKTARRTR